MPEPNWWEVEDTAPVEGGWSDYLAANSPTGAPEPTPDLWSVPTPEPTFGQSVFSGISKMPQPYIDQKAWGPPIDTNSQGPTYGDMEFAAAEDGGFSVMQSYQQEVPSIPKKKEWFESTWDTITDIAGKPLGKMVDALSWTADRTEQVIGLAYWNDVPDLSTRWEMGKLTYEMGGMPVTGWGSAGKAKSDQVRQQVLAGGDLEKIIQENEGGWTDIIMKTIFDPLWLVGGIPGLTKLPLVGGSKFAKVLNEGLAIPAIKLGVSPLESLGQKALERATKAIDSATFEGEIGKFRQTHGWFKPLPTARAEETKNYLYSTFTGITGKGLDSEELFRVGDAFRAGTPELLADTYGPAAQSFNTRLLSDVFRDQGVDIRNFASLKTPVAESEEAFKAMPGAERAGYFQNPQQQMAVFFRDLMEEAGPAIDNYFGVQAYKDRAFWGPLDKVHAVLKQALGIAYLNRPGFIMLNVANNWFTRGFTMGFGRPGYNVAELAERGILPEVFAKIAKDTGQYSREFLSDAKDPFWKKMLQVSVNLASKNDAYNRGKSYLKGYERAWNWLWNFDDTAQGGIKGFLPRLPDEMKQRLPRDFVEGLESRILSAKNEGHLTDIAQAVMAGDPGLSMEKYLLRMAQAQGLNPQQTRLFMEMDEPIKLRVNEILQRAKTPDDVVQGINKIQADLLGEVNRYREFDALPVHPRSATNFYDSVVQSEAAIRQRQQTRWDAIERMMRASGADKDTITAVRDVFTNADSTVDAARAKAWTDWTAAKEAGQAGQMTGPVTRLPESLSRSKPRYNVGSTSYLPTFESDVDKALYVLAQTTKSRADASFLAFAKSALPGKTEAELRAMGRSLRDGIKTLAQQQPTGGELKVAATFGAITPERGTVLLQSPWETYRKFRLAQKGDRDKALGDVLAQHPELARRLQFIGDVEEKAHTLVDDNWGRTFGSAGKLVDQGQRDELFVGAQKFASSTYQKEIEDTLRYLGIEPKGAAFPLPGDFPILGEMMTGQFSRTAERLERVKAGAIDDMARAATTPVESMLAPEDLRAISEYVKSLEPFMKTARTGTMDVAKAHTDFTMLNYDNKRGIDDVIKHIYPYEFWPTRTAYNWMRRTWHRPGATASLAKLYDNYADMNRDLPERLKHSVKVPMDVIEKFMDNLGIPVPGLPAWAGNDIYFDPIQVMFPIAQWSLDWADEEKQQTIPGRILDYASRVGPGMAPWVTLPLAYSGIAGDREDWISYQMSGFPFFFPGTRAQRAIAAFVATGKDDGSLDENTKYRVLLGQGLPENRLREMLGLEPGEKWDEYRINRMLANMTATHEISPEAAMDAMKMGKGKVYNKAKVLASQESGIRALTGWAFGMPISVYPEGEQIQRGIGEIRELFAREVERTGDRSIWQNFYSAFPEYQPRQAAIASDDKRAGVLDTNLYYMKQGAVFDKYDNGLDEAEANIRALEKGGGLTTKEGREIRNALKDQQAKLYEERDADIAGLKAQYPKANATPSVYDAPEERALKALRNEYYGLKGKDYTETKALREKFLGKLADEEGDMLALRREASAIINRYRAVIREKQLQKAPRSEVTKLYEQRDGAVEILTREATKGITRQRFRNFINTEKQEPTAESAEYSAASRAMGSYKALPEDRAIRQAFWDANPLLEKYYGNDEPSDAVYREIDKHWQSYYALPEGQARRDWMSINAGRLNQLNAAVGKTTTYGQPSPQTRPTATPRASFAPTQRGQTTDRYLAQAQAVRAAGGR